MQLRISHNPNLATSNNFIDIKMNGIEIHDNIDIYLNQQWQGSFFNNVNQLEVAFQ